jgi:hypothetical protein
MGNKAGYTGRIVNPFAGLAIITAGSFTLFPEVVSLSRSGSILPCLGQLAYPGPFVQIRLPGVLIPETPVQTRFGLNSATYANQQIAPM